MIRCDLVPFRPWWVEPEMPPLGPEDEDVARERERVLNGKAQSDILTMINLCKVQLVCKSYSKTETVFAPSHVCG